MSHRLEFFGISDRGTTRTSNQDRFLISEEIGCCIVADGMGGHNAGDVAALEASQTALALIHQNPSITPLKRLKHALLAAHRLVHEQSWLTPEWDGMGTTLSCALIEDKVLHLAHIGDSSILLLRNNILQKLSEDHSHRQGVTPSKRLTRCLGIGQDPKLQLASHPLHSQDLLLLCSDGLTDAVPLEVLQNVLTTDRSLKTLCEWCLELAVHHGSMDNITIVLARMID